MCCISISVLTCPACWWNKLILILCRCCVNQIIPATNDLIFWSVMCNIRLDLTSSLWLLLYWRTFCHHFLLHPNLRCNWLMKLRLRFRNSLWRWSLNLTRSLLWQLHLLPLHVLLLLKLLLIHFYLRYWY